MYDEFTLHESILQESTHTSQVSMQTKFTVNLVNSAYYYKHYCLSACCVCVVRFRT